MNMRELFAVAVIFAGFAGNAQATENAFARALVEHRVNDSLQGQDLSAMDKADAMKLVQENPEYTGPLKGEFLEMAESNVRSQLIEAKAESEFDKFIATLIETEDDPAKKEKLQEAFLASLDIKNGGSSSQSDAEKFFQGMRDWFEGDFSDAFKHDIPEWFSGPFAEWFRGPFADAFNDDVAGAFVKAGEWIADTSKDSISWVGDSVLGPVADAFSNVG